MLAWGSTAGADTIGKHSAPAGKAEVSLDGRPVPVDPLRYWVEISLPPDSRHRYRVTLDGRVTGEGEFRTYPEDSGRLCFLVLGDYGVGGPEQFAVAQAMAGQVQEQEQAGCPVRFVLTTGDNIYGKRRLLLARSETGDADAHLESRFFGPYAQVLRSVPFYPTPGNHDGSESEREGDLRAYLDNFFFPGETAAGGRYYRFSYGRLAEFLALDTTANRPVLGIGPGSEQYRWAEQALASSSARWKIPYYHHPRYCGGPTHGSRADLDPLTGLFARYGVPIVFNGHEHNWQVIEQQTPDGGTLYHVITGAGGELRRGRPGRASFDGGKARLTDWSARRHFALVEIDGGRMTVTPIGADRRPIAKPLTVTSRNGRQPETPGATTAGSAHPAAGRTGSRPRPEL